MKIGIDIHGVLEDIPDTIKFILKSITKNGGEVHIITGSEELVAYEELDALGCLPDVHYTNVVGIPEILYNMMQIEPIPGEFDSRGVPLYTKEQWDSAKAFYCLREGIDLHLDDSLFYLEHFKTPCAKLWTKDR